jgi:predicted ArsR family transcriptional regulator
VTISETRPLLDADAFTEHLRLLTSVFGDATRRAIYFYVQTNPGATANVLAEQFSIHANVARHHLEKLEEAGFVVNEERRSASVGRPAKAYRVTDVPIELTGSAKRDALLVRLLERAMDLLGPEAAEQMALAVGEEYGRELARDVESANAQASAHDALRVVADALTAHGFSARAESSDQGTSVISSACPFGDAAVHHPVLCAVDRGLIGGILEGLGSASTAVTLSSKARGDDSCRTSF